MNRTRNLCLGLLTVLTLVRAAVWIGVHPVFQIADEPAHFDNIQFRAEHYGPPRYDGTGRRIPKVMHEGAAPEVKKLWFALIPKHYFSRPHDNDPLEDELSALARTTAGRDTDGQAPAIDYPGLYYNLMVPVYRLYETSSVVSRIMAIRCFSALFGLIAVLATYLAARRVITDELLCFVAAAFVALQPMESQMTGAVNNDAGVIGFAALLFYFQLRALAELPRFPSVATLAGLILSAACLVLTKPTGYGMLPGVGVVTLAVLVVHWRDRRVQLVCAIGVGLALAILVNGRLNLAAMLPGDTENVGQYGHSDFDSFLQSLDAQYLDYLLRSSWGQFGWLDYSIHMNWLPRLRLVFGLMQVGTVVAFATHALRPLGRRFWLRGSLLGFSIGTVASGVAFILYVEHRFRLTGIMGVIQGRNFLFVLPAFAIWLVAAVGALVPRRMRGITAALLFIGAVAFNVASLTTVVHHHYVR